MKKCLYMLAGFCWGVFVFNNEILFTAIFVTSLTIITEIFAKDE